MDDAKTQRRNQGRRELTKAMVAAAQEGRALTYAELVEQVKAVRYKPYSRPLDEQLCQISRQENKAGRGMLSVVVVNGRTKMPGDGFFVLAEELGREFSSRETFFKGEFEEVLKNHRP